MGSRNNKLMQLDGTYLDMVRKLPAGEAQWLRKPFFNIGILQF